MVQVLKTVNGVWPTFIVFVVVSAAGSGTTMERTTHKIKELEIKKGSDVTLSLDEPVPTPVPNVSIGIHWKNFDERLVRALWYKAPNDTWMWFLHYYSSWCEGGLPECETSNKAQLDLKTGAVTIHNVQSEDCYIGWVGTVSSQDPAYCLQFKDITLIIILASVLGGAFVIFVVAIILCYMKKRL